MTIKDIQNKLNKFATEHPDLLNEPAVIDGGWLAIGHYIVDEPASEDNDWTDEGHWDVGRAVIALPEDTGAKY